MSANALPPLPDRDDAIRMWHKHCDAFSNVLGTAPASCEIDAMQAFAAQALTAALSSPPVLPAEPWGWAVVDKNGDYSFAQPRRINFFGATNYANEPLTAEDSARVDRDYPGLAPHRVLTLYAAPQASAPALDDARDAARWREVARRFDCAKSSRSRNILEGLGFDTDKVDETDFLASIIDAAMQQEQQ